MYKKITAVTAALFAALCVSASAEYNRYNEENYINFSNYNIGEVAEFMGISLDEFKEKYSLPEDMAADTMETAAYYNLRIKDFAELQGSSAEELIKELTLLTGKDITEDTVYKDAEADILFKTYLEKVEGLAPEQFDDFCNSLGIDGVNDETTFSEGRNKIHRILLAENGTLSYFEPDSILVMLGGKYLDFDVAPAIINDRTMVPMRSVLEKLGATVTWDGDTQTVFANRDGKLITMQIGQNYMFLNDQKIELDSPAVITDGRTLIPLRAAAEALETQVGYNKETKTVIIHN